VKRSHQLSLNTSMAEYQNEAAWLPGVGKQIEIGPADTPEPGPEELLIEVSNAVNEDASFVLARNSLFRVSDG
jgi:hypothetical protein